MAEIVYDARMSDSDALTWTIERDPVLRSTIVAVWVLDRAPDAARLRSKIEATTRAIPRLRQRVVEDPLGVAPPRWEDDPHFDLAYHLRQVRAPGKGELRDLLDVAEPIGMQAFDRDRPLWELTLVDGLNGGGCGAVMKLHHAMSDGVGLVRMTARLIEREREPGLAAADEPIPLPPDVAAQPVGALGDSLNAVGETLDALRYQAGRRLAQSRGAATALGRGVSALLRSPGDALQNAAEMAASAGRLLAPASAPLSPLLTGRSLAMRYDLLRLPLAALKSAGRAADATVNDAFVASVAGGLRRYHEALDAPVDELRMTLPINLRRGDDANRAGNQFAPVRFPVPVATVDPCERMRIIHERVAAERAEPSLPVLDVIAAAMNRLPGPVATRAFGSMLKAVDFITSNVPGPPFPVYLAGARIVAMVPFAPLAGAGVNVTLFSYDGEAQIGVNTDRAAVRDPALFRRCLDEGFAEVLAVG